MNELRERYKKETGEYWENSMEFGEDGCFFYPDLDYVEWLEKLIETKDNNKLTDEV